jgi:uncharacterized membrane protein YhaH (DUF805 family)
MQNLSPIAWALRPLKNYAKFSDRASRAEFWWFFLFIVILYFAVWVALVATVGVSTVSGSEPSFAMIGAFGAAGIFIFLFWLALIIPTIAVQVRRLHDTNRSGWWLGAFYLLYVVYFVLMFGILGSVMSAAATGENVSPTLPSSGMLTGVMLLGFTMFIYMIVLLVFYCLPGTKGVNRFGDDPYGADVAEVFA